MLRLERSSRDKLVSIFLRDKDRFLSRPLLLAFSLALTFHASLVLIFHVSPFSLSIGDFTYPPANVQADVSLKGTDMVAVAVPDPQWIRGLPPPPVSAPSTDGPPSFNTSRPIGADSWPLPGRNFFASVEESLYITEFNPMKKGRRRPLDVVVSGFLASVPLTQIPLHEAGLPKDVEAALGDEVRVVYSVTVDGRTGKVFWSEPLEQAHRVSIDRYTGQLLLGMKFAANPSGEAMSGEVEFHLRREQ